MGDHRDVHDIVNTEELTTSVVGSAADLLRAVKGSGEDNLPVRAFATTMCRAAAHLVELERARTAVHQTDPESTPQAYDELTLHARAAWRRTRAALGSATMLGDPLRERFGSGANGFDATAALFVLLGYQEQIAAALTLLEPPDNGGRRSAALRKLRTGNGFADDEMMSNGVVVSRPTVIELPEAPAAETVVVPKKKKSRLSRSPR